MSMVCNVAGGLVEVPGPCCSQRPGGCPRSVQLLEAMLMVPVTPEGHVDVHSLCSRLKPC